MMPTSPKPIYLFADSQLLFWQENGHYFLESVAAHITSKPVKAAYLGASNGDLPEYFALFREAMACVGIGDCRMIPAQLSAQDRQYLEQADLILLAGGDVEQGWKALVAHDLPALLRRRHAEGAVLIGISAGAVQLGCYGWREIGEAGLGRELFDTLNLVPYLIDAHDERNDWPRLQATVGLLGETCTGIGIPSGAGLIYHPDQTSEAVRRALDVFRGGENGTVMSIRLLPERG
jgi:peptidase E